MGTTVDAAATAAAATAAAAALLMSLTIFWMSVRGQFLLNYDRSLKSHTLGLDQFLQEIVVSCEERLEVMVNNNLAYRI